MSNLIDELFTRLKSFLHSSGIDPNHTPVIPKSIQLPNGQSGEQYFQDLKKHLPADLIYQSVPDVEYLPQNVQLNLDTLSLQGVPEQLPSTEKYRVFLLGFADRERNHLKKQFFISFSILPDPWSIWKSIEPDSSLPYGKPSSDHAHLSTAMGKCIAASQRGRSHAHDGGFREDDFAMEYDEANQILFLAVADGAGSYRHSRKGAQIVCQESIRVAKKTFRQDERGKQLLLDAGRYIRGEIPYDAIQKSVARVLGAEAALEAYRNIVQQARSDGIPVRGKEKVMQGDGYKYDGFAATLLLTTVFCVEKNWCIASFWVGDGAMVALKEGNASRLGAPEHGLDVGATNFITHLPWNDPHIGSELVSRSHFNHFNSLDYITLMTDGVSDPWLGDAIDDPNGWRSLRAELMHFFDEETLNDGAKSLCDWLNFKKKGYHDDRTIILCSFTEGFQHTTAQRTLLFEKAESAASPVEPETADHTEPPEAQEPQPSEDVLKNADVETTVESTEKSSEGQHPNIDKQTQSLDIKPQNVDTQTQNLETQTQSLDIETQNADTQTQNLDTHPQKTESNESDIPK